MKLELDAYVGTQEDKTEEDPTGERERLGT